MPSCRHCTAAFTIFPEDLTFYEEVSPVINGKKLLIPPPTLCPDCRQQRRIAFRNAHVLYRRKCDLTGKSIVSILSPDKPFKVYGHDEWWSDKWDPLGFGRPFDFSKPFFGQFHELMLVVPRMAVSSKDSENSDYVAIGGGDRNCYMVSPCFNSEDCYYGDSVYSCRDTVDGLLCEGLELSYNCINCKDGYRLISSQDCVNCRSSAYLLDCTGSEDCICCFGLKNKRFCIQNIQLTEAEYRARAIGFLQPISERGSREMQKRLTQLAVGLPHRAIHQTMSEDCTGDYFIQSNRCHDSYDLKRCEDVRYCYRVFDAKSCYDISKSGIESLELGYELMNTGYGTFRQIFSHASWACSESAYLDHCQSCQYCFGCIGLKHKKYCILNRQYSKEEYEDLLPKIIEHMRKTPLRSPDGSSAGQEWGEFFPIGISPFGYNETIAQEYFPLSRDEVKKCGWNWSDYESPIPAVDKTINASDLPDTSDEIPDDILNWAIRSDASKRPFRIIRKELEFYRTMRLPIPRLHPDERHMARLAKRKPRKLWPRSCGKCGKAMTVAFAPERKEKVLCEKCYLQTF